MAQQTRFDPGPPGVDFGLLAGPVHVPSLTGTERDRALGQLRDWVATLIRRFSIDVRVIPPCWEQHNGMVEALAALRDHERASNADTASPAAAVDWFRAFREIEARLVDIAALTQCTAHQHRQPPSTRFETSPRPTPQ